MTLENGKPHERSAAMKLLESIMTCLVVVSKDEDDVASFFDMKFAHEIFNTLLGKIKDMYCLDTSAQIILTSYITGGESNPQKSLLFR
jgi:hypothetical protein